MSDSRQNRGREQAVVSGGSPCARHASRQSIALLLGVGCALLSASTAPARLVVNSLQDLATPPAGVVTLRSALERAASGETIAFDPSLNGCTVRLSLIGEAHATLKGEVMGMTNAPSGPVSYLVGYFDRDYGASALYARKNVVIDATDLPLGITLTWMGGAANPARVLAVDGNLVLKRVSITGGWSVAAELPPPDPGDPHGQLSTRARGGAVAVWGVATLENCRLYDNHCRREFNVPARQRDSGVFGGAVYADLVDIRDCVISGNSVYASGVSGGGVFSVGGAQQPGYHAYVRRTTLTGNKISGVFAYGGGIYTDGGGIGKLKTLNLQNCTIARNQVEPAGPGFLLGMGYWRGGGVYMSNGHLRMEDCTVVQNEVYGVPRTDDLGKKNMAGGIAATIGNAHAADSMTIGRCILAGNTVHEATGVVYEHDLFTGSLTQFYSLGFNRIGAIDFSQMLVPVGERRWYSLSRRHFPKTGDEQGVALGDVLDLETGVVCSHDMVSVGVDPGSAAVWYYLPAASVVDRVPPTSQISKTFAEYQLPAGATNNFLEIMLGRLESHYSLIGFAANFTTNFEAFLASVDLDNEAPGNQPYENPDGNPILALADTQWFGPSQTWPSKLYNYPYIEFWHRIDAELEGRGIPGMGSELLGDEAWLALFQPGALSENTNILMYIWSTGQAATIPSVDQLGTARPVTGFGDVGAIELPSSPEPLLHWSLEEGNGAATLEEVSGVSNVAVCVGAPVWTNGLAPGSRHAVALGAAGSGGYLDAGTLRTNGQYVAGNAAGALTLAGSWTVTGWLRVSPAPTSRVDHVMAASAPDLAGGEWSWFVRGGTGEDLECGFDFGGEEVLSGIRLPAAADLFVAVAADSGGMSGSTNRHRFAAWDGVQWQFSGGTNWAPIRLRGMELGALDGGSGSGGVLDDVRIYGQVLEQQELERLSQADSDDDGTPDYLDPDDDNDGLTDDEEGLTGTSSKRYDSDRDGASDGEEIRAGTDPMDALERLSILQVRLADTNLFLQWSSASNRTYSIWAATNLMSNTWRLVEGGVSGTPFSNVHTMAAPFPARGYYRIVVD